jgi:hypothetical protein
MRQSQIDLQIGHSFFQAQSYRLPSTLSNYVHRFNSYMLLSIGGGVERQNAVHSSATAELITINAPESCLDLLNQAHILYGRELSDYAQYGFSELDFLIDYHNFLLWWSEYYITNLVPSHGLNAFTTWNPLTQSDQNIIAIINSELRDSLDWFWEDYDYYIREAEEYGIEAMSETIELVERFVAYTTFAFEYMVEGLLREAEAGSC